MRSCSQDVGGTFDVVVVGCRGRDYEVPGGG